MATPALAIRRTCPPRPPPPPSRSRTRATWHCPPAPPAIRSDHNIAPVSSVVDDLGRTRTLRLGQSSHPSTDLSPYLPSGGYQPPTHYLEPLAARLGFHAACNCARAPIATPLARRRLVARLATPAAAHKQRRAVRRIQPAVAAPRRRTISHGLSIRGHRLSPTKTCCSPQQFRPHRLPHRLPHCLPHRLPHRRQRGSRRTYLPTNPRRFRRPRRQLPTRRR